MGRKKRAVHPWSSRDQALAACVAELGEAAAREGIEAFTVVAEDSSGYGPNSDTFIPWVADLLNLVERTQSVRITGGLATLLWIASGARPLASEDRFDLSRKTWDEAIRRARKRERLGGDVSSWPVRSAHAALIRGERACRPRPKPTAEWVRGVLEVELEGINHVAQQLPLPRLNTLLRKILRLRAELRRLPRGD